MGFKLEEVEKVIEVYIIQYNGKSVSKDGYFTLEKAIEFIENRSYNSISVDNTLNYLDSQGNRYKILPITIK